MKIFLILLIFFNSCFLISTKNEVFQPKNIAVFDSEIGKDILNQCSRYTPKEKVNRYFDIKEEDLQFLFNNFQKVINKKPMLCCSTTGRSVKYLDKYFYQVTGIIINNIKYIYINAYGYHLDKDINKMKPYWNKKAENICDDSDNWGVSFNLKTYEFEEFVFGGD